MTENDTSLTTTTIGTLDSGETWVFHVEEPIQRFIREQETARERELNPPIYTEEVSITTNL